MTKEQHDLAAHMIEALEHPSEELTSWETNFYESVSDQFERKGWLSDRQLKILERIYAEKTA